MWRGEVRKILQRWWLTAFRYIRLDQNHDMSSWPTVLLGTKYDMQVLMSMICLSPSHMLTEPGDPLSISGV